MTSPTRARITATEIYDSAAQHPLGALFAFTSNFDGHSPHMLGLYDEFVDYLEGQVPLYQLDVQDEQTKPYLEAYRVFDVPTLLWLRAHNLVMTLGHVTVRTSEDDPGVEILFRQVGTVMLKKLQAEADQILDKIIG